MRAGGGGGTHRWKDRFTFWHVPWHGPGRPRKGLSAARPLEPPAGLLPVSCANRPFDRVCLPSLGRWPRRGNVGGDALPVGASATRMARGRWMRQVGGRTRRAGVRACRRPIPAGVRRGPGPTRVRVDPSRLSESNRSTRIRPFCHAAESVGSGRDSAPVTPRRPCVPAGPRQQALPVLRAALNHWHWQCWQNQLRRT